MPFVIEIQILRKFELKLSVRIMPHVQWILMKELKFRHRGN